MSLTIDMRPQIKAEYCLFAYLVQYFYYILWVMTSPDYWQEFAPYRCYLGAAFYVILRLGMTKQHTEWPFLFLEFVVESTILMLPSPDYAGMAAVVCYICAFYICEGASFTLSSRPRQTSEEEYISYVDDLYDIK